MVRIFGHESSFFVIASSGPDSDEERVKYTSASGESEVAFLKMSVMQMTRNGHSPNCQSTCKPRGGFKDEDGKFR